MIIAALKPALGDYSWLLSGSDGGTPHFTGGHVRSCDAEHRLWASGQQLAGYFKPASTPLGLTVTPQEQQGTASGAISRGDNGAQSTVPPMSKCNNRTTSSFKSGAAGSDLASVKQHLFHPRQPTVIGRSTGGSHATVDTVTPKPTKAAAQKRLPSRCHCRRNCNVCLDAAMTD